MRDPLCGTRPHPFSATDFVDPCFHPKYMEKASRFAHEVHDEPLFLSHKPTMPLFTFMPTSPGDGGLRIIERIGAKYRALGILLLDDKNGVKTEAAVASHPQQPATITHSILSSWLNGRGKEPVTWATFIAVLYQVGLRDLARDIEKQTTQDTLPSEPTSDFTQDPKQNTAGALDAEEQTKQERELVAVNGSESLSIVILATSSDEVKKMIEVLYNRFSDLKNFVKESLEKHGIFVKKVVDVLTSLSPDDDEHHKMFLETHIKALVTAADNSELFVTMNFHWNYLDPSLLDHLVRKLDLNKVKAQMEAYKLDLQKFRTETPLSLYCQAHKRKRIKLPPDFQEVLAEFSWSEHIQITLEVVEQFRQEYASHYKLHEFAMMLSEVRPGSFVVTWVIPQSITEKLEQNLPRKILRKYNVTKVMVAETLVYSCPVTEETLNVSSSHCTGESFTSLAEASSSRPRVGSTGSSVYSFHTACSSPLPSRGDGRRREAVVEEEAKQWFLSMRDELLGSMREIREKVNELERKVDNIERKVDNIEQKLESRVEGVEKQIQNIYNDIMSSPTRLSSLTEVEEENTDKETKDLEKSSQLQQKPKRVIGPLRKRFTDTDFLKVSRYRQLLTKRKTFTQQKALSVQDSRRQLPQKQCSQQVIVWLTQKITHWKFIARWLGLQDSDVETIATNNPQDVREQCYQMFKKWRSTDPGNFTYHVLGEALKIESEVKLFNEYVEEVHRVENTIDVPDHD